MAGLSDVDLLGRLVGFDTVSHKSNLPLADFVAEYAGPEATVERHLSPDGDKANLILRFGPEQDDRSGLVLSGHMDVVPAEEEEWESDPFALRDDGERLFGRGTCDMKGFLAVALNVAREARGLKAPLVLVFTHDEEVGTLGARRLVEAGPAASLPRQAIVGEPTRLVVVRMHKGFTNLRVTLQGVSAHSGYPHLGKNAIEGMARVLVSLRGLRHRWEKAGGPNAEYFPEVPYVSLNVGVIAGGTATNIVPDRCVLGLGVRPLPGTHLPGIVGSIREAVANAAGDMPFSLEQTGESPPLLLDADAAVHRTLMGLTGQEVDASVSFATDAGWLARAGMECVVFGPGSITEAHKPNEFVSKADLARARTCLEQAVERLACHR